MASHADMDHDRRREFLKEINLRAEIMESLGKSSLAAGDGGESALASWSHDGIRCQLMPDDWNSVLRISIGGGPDLPVNGDYCTVRGDVGKCIALLQRAIVALSKCP